MKVSLNLWGPYPPEKGQIKPSEIHLNLQETDCLPTASSIISTTRVPKNKNTPGGSCWIYGKTQSANWLGRIIWAIPWDMFFTIVSCKQTTSTLQLLSKFLILWHLSLSFKPPNIPQKDFFFFFWIDNERNFIKKKLANLSTLGMYCGGKNQEPKLLWSSKAGKEKQEICDKATLQTRRVCKKKDLISNKDCSHPSKHLAFLSLQIHHIKQCGKRIFSFISSILPLIHLLR